MIIRWIVHVEAHRGYRPHINIRRAPRAGDITPWGVLVLCPHCQDGHLALMLQPHPSSNPIPEGHR